MYYVYKYIDELKNVLYVGQTCDIDRRINEHKDKIWNLKKDKILYAKCNTCTDMNIYEMYYINKLKPIYNLALIFNDFPSFSIPDLDWVEYNENHYEVEKKIRDNEFKDKIKEKFDIEKIYLDKIATLEDKYHNTTDIVEKEKIQDKINTYQDKLKDYIEK